MTAVALARGRVPVQARAKARVAALLDAAGELLVADGIPINLTAVAERAEVPIGSLYQYFPSHAALVRALAERHLTDSGGSIVDRLSATPGSGLDLEAALRSYLDLSNDPLAVAVMRAIRADPALRRIDRVDTENNTARVVGALADSGLDVTPERKAQVDLAIELSGALVLILADRPPRARPALVDRFVELILTID